MSDLVAHNEEKDRQTLDLLAALVGHLSRLPEFPQLKPIDITIEMNRIVRLSEAARLRGISPDTLERNEAEKILNLGPRCRGMRIKDALLLSERSA
jgi:hypothetical protein